KRSNVLRVKLSLLSKSDDTFLSLQALLDLYYLFGGFMDYLWSYELNISNFGPADRKTLPVRSYANVRQKPLEFQVRDRVILKVSPRKGVIQFGKQGKLNPQYIRPFNILKRVGPVAYKLELPKELSNVHNTFHVSTLKKRLSHESLYISMKELRLDDKLNFVKEPVEIMDQEVKQLRQSCIPIVKVRWNSKGGP
nr:putative reverse transcriptase domain-containing protein [Tanacetum cinerariifolium]